MIHSDSGLFKKVLGLIEDFILGEGHLEKVEIGAEDSFNNFGIDSALGVELAFSIGEELSVNIDPTLLFDCRTIYAFADAVTELASEK